jgi:hypothetical protein
LERGGRELCNPLDPLPYLFGATAIKVKAVLADAFKRAHVAELGDSLPLKPQ